MKHAKSLHLVLFAAALLSLPSRQVLGALTPVPQQAWRSGRALPRRSRRIRTYHKALPASELRMRHTANDGSDSSPDQPNFPAIAFLAPQANFSQLHIVSVTLLSSDIYSVSPSRYLLFCCLLI
jgi:hypothetical protein